MNTVKITEKNLAEVTVNNTHVISQLQKQIKLAMASLNRTEANRKVKKLRAKLARAVALQAKLTNPAVMRNVFNRERKHQAAMEDKSA